MAVYRKVTGNTMYLMDNEEEVLKVEETIEENKVLVSLAGKLRSDTEHELRDELMTLTLLGMDIVLDISGVGYISAACQQALLMIQQKMDQRGKGSLLLRGLTPALQAEFQQTGLYDLLMIEE